MSCHISKLGGLNLAKVACGRNSLYTPSTPEGKATGKNSAFLIGPHLFINNSRLGFHKHETPYANKESNSRDQACQIQPASTWISCLILEDANTRILVKAG